MKHIQRLTVFDRDDNPCNPVCVICGAAEEFCVGTKDNEAINRIYGPVGTTFARYMLVNKLSEDTITRVGQLRLFNKFLRIENK